MLWSCVAYTSVTEHPLNGKNSAIFCLNAAANLSRLETRETKGKWLKCNTVLFGGNWLNLESRMQSSTRSDYNAIQKLPSEWSHEPLLHDILQLFFDFTRRIVFRWFAASFWSSVFFSFSSTMTLRFPTVTPPLLLGPGLRHPTHVGSVVRTSVFDWRTYFNLRLIYGWHVTTSWVRCPLWVNQPGQLSLPSSGGR